MAKPTSGPAKTGNEQPSVNGVTAYDELMERIKTKREVWNRTASTMTRFHIGLRVALIVGSAIVSTRDQLAPSPLAWLIPLVPILAIGVTIFTTLDTWLKPGLRAQSLMRSRDEIDGLLDAEQFAKWNDPEVHDLLESWKEILRRHRIETDIS